MKRYDLDGNRITGLASFFEVFAEMVNGNGGYFGRTLIAWNDCLYGGYGMEYPCEIFWNDSEQSRKYLDRQCRLEYLMGELKRWDDEEMLNSLNKAIQSSLDPDSPTMMDLIVETLLGVPNGSPNKFDLTLHLR